MNVIYKFRITSEIHDDFLREIEISANQTFEEFHFEILKSISFEGEELASFYMCDKLWNRQKEITLLDMSEGENHINYMNECKLKDFIIDDDQKIMYEYDFLNPQTFLIELVKIKPPQSKVQYPRCVKKSGKIMTKPKSINSLIPDLNEDLEMNPEDIDMLNMEEEELSSYLDVDGEDVMDDYDK